MDFILFIVLAAILGGALFMAVNLGDRIEEKEEAGEEINLDVIKEEAIKIVKDAPEIVKEGVEEVKEDLKKDEE